jgi:hypothetical protein
MLPPQIFLLYLLLFVPPFLNELPIPFTCRRVTYTVMGALH